MENHNLEKQSISAEGPPSTMSLEEALLTIQSLRKERDGLRELYVETNYALEKKLELVKDLQLERDGLRERLSEFKSEANEKYYKILEEHVALLRKLQTP